MSVYDALSAAIKARAEADATLYGAAGYIPTGGVRFDFAGRDAAFPYLCYSFPNEGKDDALRTRVRVVTVRFDLWILEQEMPTPSVPPRRRGAGVIDRLLGDWEAQTYGTGPSYGFERWQPTVSGWDSNPMEFRSLSPSHDEGVLHWSLDFELRLNKAGA